MKSPVSYLTDSQFSALPLAERALHVARSQVGVKEVPSGSNWGPMVKIFLAFAGWKSPQPWCAAFIGYCIVQAGGKKSQALEGACIDLEPLRLGGQDQSAFKGTEAWGSLCLEHGERWSHGACG
jgi:hypothetical protein